MYIVYEGAQVDRTTKEPLPGVMLVTKVEPHLILSGPDRVVVCSDKHYEDFQFESRGDVFRFIHTIQDAIREGMPCLDLGNVITNYNCIPKEC